MEIKAPPNHCNGASIPSSSLCRGPWPELRAFPRGLRSRISLHLRVDHRLNRLLPTDVTCRPVSPRSISRRIDTTSSIVLVKDHHSLLKIALGVIRVPYYHWL